MIGAIWSGVKLAGKAKNVIKAGIDSKDEIAGLWGDWQDKWDTDKDGKPDLTVAEATEFLGRVCVMVAKKL